MMVVSVNFAFLAAHDPQLVRLGALAEQYFTSDSNTCLIKLRQFGELLAQLVGATRRKVTEVVIRGVRSL